MIQDGPEAQSLGYCCAVQAIQSLQACVQANAAGKGFLMGWGVESAGAASDAGVTAAIRQTNEQLAALGVPGVTAGTGLSTPGGSSNNDPCGNPVPWTGLLCSGDRITQVYGPQHEACCHIANSTRQQSMAVSKASLKLGGRVGSCGSLRSSTRGACEAAFKVPV